MLLSLSDLFCWQIYTDTIPDKSFIRNLKENGFLEPLCPHGPHYPKKFPTSPNDIHGHLAAAQVPCQGLSVSDAEACEHELISCECRLVG